MRFREIIEASAGGIRKPLTPEQLARRNDRMRKTQQKIRDVQARSAARVQALKTDLP